MPTRTEDGSSCRRRRSWRQRCSGRERAFRWGLPPRRLHTAITVSNEDGCIVMCDYQWGRRTALLVEGVLFGVGSVASLLVC